MFNLKLSLKKNYSLKVGIHRQRSCENWKLLFEEDEEVVVVVVVVVAVQQQQNNILAKK